VTWEKSFIDGLHRSAYPYMLRRKAVPILFKIDHLKCRCHCDEAARRGIIIDGRRA
jgi:hypothetical protein